MQHTNRPEPGVRRAVFALAILAVFGLLAANGCPPQTIQEAKLLASDGAAEDRFGSAVSVSGDVAVVGAIYDDDNGSAYVYRFDDTSWVEEAKLLASDGAQFDRFGNSVAVSGDVAVVGAFKNAGPFGVGPGSAYVYRFDGTSWVEEAELLASDGTPNDFFGRSVAVSGDVAVVGDHGPFACGAFTCRWWPGSAYVYRFDGTSWVEEAKLLASDGAPRDFFGFSVAVSGDVAVVGAIYDDDNGSAYVYRFDGTSWVEEAKLLASDGAPFGNSVAVSGDVAVVGAGSDHSAYVYRFEDTSWVEEAKLLASDGLAADGFGVQVSLSGGVAVVGAYGDDDNGADSGSAYVYRFDGTSWVEEAKLLASDGAAVDRFGSAVSVSGDVAVVGAHYDDDNGNSSGSAYVFSPLSGIPACSDARDNDGDGLADLDDPGCAVALDTSEHSGLFQCDDGRDNDGDGFTDYPEDPGCREPGASPEDPQCQDGAENDRDGLIDFDGGQSIRGDCSAGLCPPGVSDPDGDGVADPDPECGGEPWATREFIPDCDDGEDSDGDGFTDYPEDPGCRDATSVREDPQCQDGINNDPGQDPDPGLIDFDGGQSIHGTCSGGACPPGVSDPDGDGVADPDPQCEQAWNGETQWCGLGFELALILPGLMWLHGRRRRLH